MESSELLFEFIIVRDLKGVLFCVYPHSSKQMLAFVEKKKGYECCLLVISLRLSLKLMWILFFNFS